MPLPNDEYVALEEPVCPFCNSPELDWRDIDFDGKYVKQEVSCHDCDKEWYDIYELKGYEER